MELSTWLELCDGVFARTCEISSLRNFERESGSRSLPVGLGASFFSATATGSGASDESSAVLHWTASIENEMDI